MKIAHACDRLGLQQAKELSDPLVRFKSNLEAKVNEQRLVARGEKLHFFGERDSHLAAVYSIRDRATAHGFAFQVGNPRRY